MCPTAEFNGFQLSVDEEERYEAILREEREQELMRKRNKSRLSFSQREMMHGRPPLAGVHYAVRK